MTEKKLTKAYIKKRKESSNIQLDISLLELEDLDLFPYLLVIQSTSSKFSKITIYPLKKNKITKIFLSGTDISEKIFDDLSKTLQNFEIIHSSGLLVIEKELQYECYLNFSLSDKEFKELKNALEKIRDSLKEIKFEEITIV